jgi:hypothetical protein
MGSKSVSGTAAMACPKCGSWAVKADRSLAGRMVCARCGQVLGLQVVDGGRAKRGRRRGAGRATRGSQPRRWHGWLGLGLVVGVAALLASLPPRGRREAPSPVPTSGEGVPISRGADRAVVAIR